MAFASIQTRPLRPAQVQLYRFCEELTEPLILLMVIFSPWAFGTTQPWAIWSMNIAGCFLGLLLAAKLAVRLLKGYRPPRWDGTGLQGYETTGLQDYRTTGLLSRCLVGLTIAILGYCLVSALNASATYRAAERNFEYHSYLKWLPHSFDSGRTWFNFWSYLGLACSFWAIRDWLLGKTGGEQRAEARGRRGERRGEREEAEGTQAFQHSNTRTFLSAPFPARVRRLLWILAINGALVGIEGIVQRLEGSGRLLFLIKPQINPQAISQFGPYHYRANASAFFNLLWPVSLGFWWVLNRPGIRSRPQLRPQEFEGEDEDENENEDSLQGDDPGRKAHHVLLLCSVIMAACPIISSCRGGALVTLGIVVLAAVLLPGAHLLLSQKSEARRRGKSALVLVGLCLASGMALGLALGWKALRPRLAQISEGYEGREQMYAAARPMAADYPLFGIGPGAFDSVFQLYRISTETYWPAQLHNDWLETRITFGWLGSLLIYAALTIVLSRWFARGGIHGGRRFMILAWLALAGCLVHARFDFPFQVHSILFLFLVLCAVLFNLSRKP